MYFAAGEEVHALQAPAVLPPPRNHAQMHCVVQSIGSEDLEP